MSDFYQQLLQAIGTRPPTEVQVAPRLDPKRMANARKWAPFGQEHPMLLLDNSVFGSGKAGVLVTSHALYFDSPPTRIELPEIVEPPVYPEGLTERGSLRTRRAELQLPLLLDSDVAEIFKRVLLAIVAFNRGTSSAPVLPVQGPVGELALRLLRCTEVHLAPDLPRKKVRSAAATFSDWLDHANGEQPIAYLDETTFGKGNEGLLLTDRRLLAYTDEKHVMIPYGAITHVSSARSLLGRKLRIDAAQHSAEISLIACAAAVEPLALFLQGLLQLPPNQRWAPSVAPATAQDPSGAFGLLQALDAPDARIPIMLRYVGEMTRQGAMPPAMAADFVTRIHLLHRTMAHGRGMAQGWRVSPLQGADFHFMLSTVFGDPLIVSSSQQPSGPYRGTPGAIHHTLDFALGRRPNVAGVATAVVGLALLAVVGVGWLSTPKSTLQTVRVVTTDLPASTGFAPLGVQGGRTEPLADLAPQIVDQILDALDNIEALITFYRIVFGWGLWPQQLLQWGAELPARVAQVLGPTDLSAFDRVRD
ncbi:MAG: hypothetical protein ACMG6S_03865 [Byssovorax sp.]